MEDHTYRWLQERATNSSQTRKAKKEERSPIQTLQTYQRSRDPTRGEKTIKENFDNTQQESAKQKFSRHFGKLNLDYITPVDNDSINTDLAQEYMANSEDI